MKYTVLKIIPIFALWLYCATLIQAKEWRGIVASKSTRADVERLLGNSMALVVTNLITNGSKYKKSRSAHLPSIVNFTNDEEGITYTVDEEDEEVMHITYLPSARECQNLVYRTRPGKRVHPIHD